MVMEVNMTTILGYHHRRRCDCCQCRHLWLRLIVDHRGCAPSSLAGFGKPSPAYSRSIFNSLKLKTRIFLQCRAHKIPFVAFGHRESNSHTSLTNFSHQNKVIGTKWSMHSFIHFLRVIQAREEEFSPLNFRPYLTSISFSHSLAFHHDLRKQGKLVRFGQACKGYH